jgi:ABC-type multidrug transport system ATPase subunit
MTSDKQNGEAAAVECRDVTKVYRSLWSGRSAGVRALDNVSLRIGTGTIIGLIGPNGAGKTTFLSLIAGLLVPTRGQIRVCGHAARSVGARRHLGYVPESPVFLARYSARAVLQYHAALRGLSRRDISVEADRLLEQVKLTEYAQRSVGGFSQGMRQRLALAVALIDRPRLLLLDEPSNGLDPIGIIELRRVLSELKQAGATVLISSHRLGELEKLTQDYVFLDRGRIVQFSGANDDQAQTRRLRIELLDGSPEITAESLAPYRLLEVSPTRLTIGVSGANDTPEVVRRMVEGGARVTSVNLEGEDIEQTFVRLCQERTS